MHLGYPPVPLSITCVICHITATHVWVVLHLEAQLLDVPAAHQDELDPMERPKINIAYPRMAQTTTSAQIPSIHIMVLLVHNPE